MQKRLIFVLGIGFLLITLLLSGCSNSVSKAEEETKISSLLETWKTALWKDHDEQLNSVFTSEIKEVIQWRGQDPKQSSYLKEVFVDAMLELDFLFFQLSDSVITINGNSAVATTQFFYLLRYHANYQGENSGKLVFHLEKIEGHWYINQLDWLDQVHSTLEMSDDFNDPESDWYVETFTDVSYQYVNGQYEIRVNEANMLYWSYAPLVEHNQFTMETEMTAVEGKGEYGFIFNYVDFDNHYIFSVNPYTQQYQLIQIINGTWIAKTPLVDSAHITTQTNRLKIIQYNNELQLYCNDNLLEQVPITLPTEPFRLALLVEVGEGDTDLPYTVRFDNFYYRRMY